MKLKKGVILILVVFIIVIFLILLSVFIGRGIQEKELTQRQRETFAAFNLAEAGVDRSVVELRNNFNWTGVGATALGSGEYRVVVTVIDGERKLDSFGYVPTQASARATQHIEAQIKKATPGNFYDNAVYSAGDVDFNGNSFSVVNNEPPPDNEAVLYADDYDVQQPQNITGTSTQDPNISPLARLDFTQLRALSAGQGAGQGNVYDAARLQAVKNGSDSFPTSFWYQAGVPNVVYVEADLQLSGNIGTIGGFFVVVGDVLTDPSGGADATINGNGQIDGCIYTLGDFKINGGGGNLNVDGGIWAADEITLNGNASVSYNPAYMNAIDILGIHPDVQVVSWRQI